MHKIRDNNVGELISIHQETSSEDELLKKEVEKITAADTSIWILVHKWQIRFKNNLTKAAQSTYDFIGAIPILA